MEKNLTIDLGNGWIKYRNHSGELKKLRATTLLENTMYDMEGRHSINIYNDSDNSDIYYLIGEADGNYCADARRYRREEYKALLLTAIGLSLMGEIDASFDVKLALNLPLRLYKEGKIEHYLAENLTGSYHFKVDNREFNISIAKIFCFPENLVISLLDKKDVAMKNVFVDIGNGTVDLLFTEDSRLGTLKTEYTGIASLYTTIYEKSQLPVNMIEKYWANLSQVPIRGNSINAENIKKSCIKEYALNIVDLIESANKGTLDDINKIYLLGGGSHLIDDELQSVVDQQVVPFPQPEFANFLCIEKMFAQILKNS